MVYEQVDLKILSQKAFPEVVYRADELIMKPFTCYRKVLPNDMQVKIYNDLDSPIAQFKSETVLNCLLGFPNRMLGTRFHLQRLGHFASLSFPAYGGKIQAIGPGWSLTRISASSAGSPCV
jgi:hypothetical protein